VASPLTYHGGKPHVTVADVRAAAAVSTVSPEDLRLLLGDTMDTIKQIAHHDQVGQALCGWGQKKAP
jgi:hypothetical protein